MREKLKKKNRKHWLKMWKYPLLTALLMFLPLFPAVGQQSSSKLVTIKAGSIGVKAALDTVASQTGAYIMYEETVIDKNLKISLNLNNVSLSEAVGTICRQANLDYSFKDSHVLIKEKRAESKKKRSGKLTGTVVDSENNPMIAVLVNISGTNNAATTDADGYYSLEVPENIPSNARITFTLLGMKPVTHIYNGEPELNITMENDMIALTDVVITGYFNKDKKSFTGSEISVKAEDLKNLGATNVLSVMSVYSPSLRITEQLEFGSDPNHIPEMTLRGQSTFDLRGSAEGSRANPNSPLFILDGIEVSAQTVYDYDINQIDQITILKDASATAIYGSRGANGVIVMTTRRPVPGKIKVGLNLNFGISAPDLSDYNLMNAAEKLEYERLAGLYINATGGLEGQQQLDELYNSRLQEVYRGVDTYWLSQPLQTSVSQRYTLNLEGGDNQFRYMITGRYDDESGVMKESGRKKYGIRAMFDYNVGENFRIRNDLSVSDLTASNSPFGSFRDYTMQNPYDRIYDSNGELINILSYNRINPMVNASLPNRDITNTTGWQDNVNLEWRFLNAFRLQGRLSYSKSASKAETFISPNSPLFESETDIARKGKASFFNPVETTLDGNLILSYYNVFNNVHTLNVSAGSNVVATEYKGEGFTATGFLNDNLTNIYFAQQFAENSKPRAEQDVSRLIGFLINTNYGYANRYYLDFSFRSDGSSKFGSKSRYAPFWSVGFAWNVHEESFLDKDLMTLKLRASAGSTGNINFASSQAITKYLYSPDNVYLDDWGASLTGYGNEKLKWQTTLAYNAGFDLSFLKNRISLFADAYIKRTNNLLLPVNVAPSTGFTYYTENVGEVENKGLETRLQLNLLKQKDWNWLVTFSAFHNSNKIRKISNELEEMNNRLNSSEDSNIGGTVAYQFEKGNSVTALYLVRSAGIDPATGNEIYIKRDGSYSFYYDFRDKVVIGDTEPVVNGNIVNSISWKNLNVYAVLACRTGGKAYNTTLATKVDNVNPRYNADKRVLYDRWQQPGDVAMFRRIDDLSTVYQTDRLVQRNDYLTMPNLSVTYIFPASTSKKFGCEYLKLIAATTDLFRISSIKQERGLDYPYARTFTMSINASF